MTVGGSGFGVLEWENQLLAYLRHTERLRPGRPWTMFDGKRTLTSNTVPSDIDNRYWFFYEIWDVGAWKRLALRGWPTLEDAMQAEMKAGRLTLARIIRSPTGELRRYVYDIAHTTLLWPPTGEVIRIGEHSVGNMLYFHTGRLDDQLVSHRSEGDVMIDNPMDPDGRRWRLQVYDNDSGMDLYEWTGDIPAAEFTNANDQVPTVKVPASRRAPLTPGHKVIDHFTALIGDAVASRLQYEDMGKKLPEQFGYPAYELAIRHAQLASADGSHASWAEMGLHDRTVAVQSAARYIEAMNESRQPG